MDTNLLTRLAQAYMARERMRTGVAAEDRAAQQVQGEDVMRRAQAARIAQQLELAPAEQESEIALRDAQANYYNAGGRQTAPKPPDVGSFPDYVTRKYGENPTSEQIAEARRVYGQADDRTRQPPISLNLPIAVMDKKTGQMTYVSREDALRDPGRYVPPPTTAERNVASGSTIGQQNLQLARKRAMPVLQDLGSRAMQLNSGNEGGFVDRVGGLGRRVAGSLGADSASDLYTTGVRGFVPLFARAVGHVGVLTELDVKRTEELFPRIGDAESVSAEKLARLQRIMTGQEPVPFQWSQPSYDEGGITQPGSGRGTPPAAGGTFKVLGRRQ